MSCSPAAQSTRGILEDIRITARGGRRSSRVSESLLGVEIFTETKMELRLFE